MPVSATRRGFGNEGLTPGLAEFQSQREAPEKPAEEDQALVADAKTTSVGPFGPRTSQLPERSDVDQFASI